MLRTLAAMVLFTAATANAAMVERKVSYSLDGTDFESTLVYDDGGQGGAASPDATAPASLGVKAPASPGDKAPASPALRPGLLLVPNWYGAGDAAVAKAKTIAGKDYVILVADVYGKDVRPTNDQEAGAVPIRNKEKTWPERG
jgi:hypothetical protein